MQKVIAVFDVGKTNKKLLLYNKDFEVVYTNSIRFEEIVDDDNYPSAHFIIGRYKLKFNRANFNGEKIHADVIIEKLS